MKENEIKTQDTAPKKGKNVFMKILNTIVNIMIVLVLIVSIIIAVMAVTSKATGVSTIFGYTIQPIQTDSMQGGSPDGYPEGDFSHGDLMIAKPVGKDYKGDFKAGDIVTYVMQDSTGQNMLIVHRIIDVKEDSNGEPTYQTQGDNRETSPVPDQQDPKDYLRKSDIATVYYTDGYIGKIFKGWGAPLDFLRTQPGFFFVVLLPMIIFFLYERVRVVMNVMNYKKAKADEEKDEAVKTAVAQALAEQEEEKDDIRSVDDMTPAQREQFKQFLEMQKEQQKAQKDETEIPEQTDTSDGE